ncbi:dephospho-CoA kinase [Actinopolyspora biskrensis]|uniref:Dephospho-CoA kinase n=1 Tax=Actinopolyspora biskrensis TaxID=1470178 RepID=A0A852YSK9_9ACTN|nr:dephospho-CoA kinase [Actinopolyspora biskrensis]NYH78214.1 dephospho-CoA kinase [Actinopolyspora biskrensis]
MLRVGLTGGIGSGKSTVANRLAEHGAVVVDADLVSREVVEPGTEGLSEIVEHFGAEVLDEDGTLNRSALARVVFGDDAARSVLNGIVHPRVAVRTAELIAAAPEDAVVVHDVALLVENGYQADYHLVVVVDAPVEQRVRRLVDRGLSAEDARSRIEAQADERQRRAAADVWLDNGSEQWELRAEVDRLWETRLVPFEANVRDRVPQCPSGPPVLVAPDPEWPEQARRLAARIARATGGGSARIDHVGSTSVPGLASEDVLDLQLTVRTPDEADALAEPLAAAGFPRLPGHDSDEQCTEDPAEQWWKRRHVSADPGRRVELDLRVEGRSNWRLALLFPAWLRAEEQARAEYEELKSRCAELFASDVDSRRYAEAKRAWFEQALPRAERWAARTGWSPYR